MLRRDKRQVLSIYVKMDTRTDGVDIEIIYRSADNRYNESTISFRDGALLEELDLVMPVFYDWDGPVFEVLVIQKPGFVEYSSTKKTLREIKGAPVKRVVEIIMKYAKAYF